MNKISPEMPELQSMNITADNITKLKSLFPEAFSEGSIDFDVLKQLLGANVDEKEERYGLNWHGKRQARQLALTPSRGTLRPCKDESVDWHNTKNLMIEGDVNSAVELSLYIRDVDFIRQCFDKIKFNQPEYVIKFAELLIDELCAGEAILVLNQIKDDKTVDHAGLRDKWAEVFALALIEEGEVQQAKTICLDGFKNRCDVVFYKIYNRVEKVNDSLGLFSGIAKSKGFPFVVLFLSAIDNYGKLDSEIMNASKNEIKDMMVLLRGSFIRSLSSELYRHGYACSATLLRRVLVEDSISRSQSKYYTYAASDMKKSIDYSKNIVWTEKVPSTEEYFKSLFVEHKRKYALWEMMLDKIDGLAIEKDSVSYSA